MKGLMRRLARVVDSSRYQQIHNKEENHHDGDEDSSDQRRRRQKVTCPQGHVPVCVGDEMERFVVPAHLLNRPVFAELLNRSAQEYGYDHKGVLRIPCSVHLFRRLLSSEIRV